MEAIRAQCKLINVWDVAFSPGCSGWVEPTHSRSRGRCTWGQGAAPTAELAEEERDGAATLPGLLSSWERGGRGSGGITGRPRLGRSLPAEEISQRHGLRNKVQGRIISAVIASLSMSAGQPHLICRAPAAMLVVVKTWWGLRLWQPGSRPSQEPPLLGSGSSEGWGVVCPGAEFASLPTQGSRSEWGCLSKERWAWPFYYCAYEDTF